MASEAWISGAYEVPYLRHAPEHFDTARVLAQAVIGALADAGIGLESVDGFGVASFTLRPDHAVDLAWRMGLKLRWLMEDPHGGASGLNLLQHAVRAVEAGDAETVVICAGDHFKRGSFADLVTHYNRATQEFLTPTGVPGPNALFAMMTASYLEAHHLDRAGLGRIPVSQRRWAALNPKAVYRDELTLEQYLAAPMIATPLGRYDCSPVVTGADALVITSRATNDGVKVRAIGGRHNVDDQQGEALESGFAELMPQLWRDADARPEDLDAAFIYDDYPVMVAVQANDLGLISDGDIARWLTVVLGEKHWPLNTSGGQLSAGQAGAAGGMHGLVEAVTQLRGQAVGRQVAARLALVTGYGMVLYRHGASHLAVVLEGTH
jgi:acetyl-CoA acetyltransferase